MEHSNSRCILLFCCDKFFGRRSMFLSHLRATLNFWICIIFMLSIVRVGFPIDLCAQFSPDDVALNFRTGVRPRGRAEAGDFYEDGDAKNFEDCVKSCCKNRLCNVAFHVNDVCLMISCNASWPDACEPEETKEEKFRDSFWLTLRPWEMPRDSLVSSLPFSSSHDQFDPLPLRCQTNSDCDAKSEVCRSMPSEFPAIRRCYCAPGYSLDSYSHQCKKSPGLFARPCTVGLSNCLPVEECVPKNSRSRIGSCECKDGYNRPSPEGHCLPNVVTDAIENIPHITESTHRTTTTFREPTSSVPSTPSTTLAVPKLNQAPVARVAPASQQVWQPNDLSIDGSGSSDDVRIVSYEWKVVAQPMETHFDISPSDAIKSALVIKGLSPGFYQFKLTVTDNNGLKNSAYANATVIKEIDNPPVADAGRDVVVDLPTKEVVLYGNASRDDKKIVAYEWLIKSSDSPAVDMEGVRTPFLKLSNPEAGLYTFTLKVTDSSGQSSTADVHLIVRPEQNLPPVAVAGPNQTVSLPLGFVTLNGSGSSDDQKIESYEWTLISGPNSPVIDNRQSAIASVSNLVVGTYLFRLTVRDRSSLESSAVTSILVTEGTVVNHAPTADAGGNLVVTLPIDVVKINGSLSTDDKGIVSYVWKKDVNSPAAGEVLLNSDHEPVLLLTNVVSGRYVFTLEVRDAEGLTHQDAMSLIVKPDPFELSLVELRLVTDASSFTEKHKARLTDNLALLIGNSNSSRTTRVIVHSSTADAMSGLVVVTFYVETIANDQNVLWHGPDVLSSLKKTIPSNQELLDFHIAQFDTVVCQNNCSGHGTCDPMTRSCICDELWVQDFIKAHFGERESNCDWSLLYVVLVIVSSILIAILLIVTTIVLCKCCNYCKPKLKRHRYMLLDERNDDDEEDGKNTESLQLLRRGRKQNSSLMQSESDFSSEEDTIYVSNKRPANGSVGRVPNGSTRKSKVKA